MSKQTPEILKYFLEDLLFGIPGFSYKKMFGSYGIYRFGKMFSILDESEEFYFKVGENNINDYLEINSKQFSYIKMGKTAYLSFYKIPEELLENRENLLAFIEKSLSVPAKTKKTIKNKDLSKKVLESLKEIPFGKVTTYKILADKFGVHPRTIASIMKYNKETEVFPCYKVIAQDGNLGGYNTKRGLVDKIERLEKERIKIENKKIDKKYFY